LDSFQYRSPEEYNNKALDEKVDIFSFGNNIYALLTGLWPFYDTNSNDEVQEKIRNGELPFVDPRFQQQSYGEKKLVEILQRCWIYDPSKRADIFEIVQLLQDTLRNIENHIDKN